MAMEGRSRLPFRVARACPKLASLPCSRSTACPRCEALQRQRRLVGPPILTGRRSRLDEFRRGVLLVNLDSAMDRAFSEGCVSA